LSITIWRISKQKYAATAFSGIGARLSGGRWNSQGTSIVYTSATLSLAALETFVHMEIEDAGNMLVSIRAEIGDDVQIETIDPTQLPDNWRDMDSPQALALIGDRWFFSASTAILRVPSAIIPQENNYLINPLHQDFGKITIHPPQPFVLDRRLWKKTL